MKQKEDRPKLRGDITKPHLRKFFKTVPMKDEEGKDIPNNPQIQHGGPWQKTKVGITLGKDVH